MLIIIGKSGSGKTTVVDELVKRGYQKVVTDTTRPMRPNEVDGVDYNFLTKEEFEENIRNEWYAEYVTYNASFGEVMYGSRLADYERADSKEVIILNPYGLKMALGLENQSVKNLSTSIYLKLSDELILKRLALRGDAKEEIERRLETDRVDFEGMEDFCDYTIEITEETTVVQLANEIDKLLVKLNKY